MNWRWTWIDRPIVHGQCPIPPVTTITITPHHACYRGVAYGAAQPALQLSFTHNNKHPNISLPRPTNFFTIKTTSLFLSFPFLLCSPLVLRNLYRRLSCHSLAYTISTSVLLGATLTPTCLPALLFVHLADSHRLFPSLPASHPTALFGLVVNDRLCDSFLHVPQQQQPDSVPIL